MKNFLLLLLISCSGRMTFAQDSLPKTIDESVNYFIKTWPPETKKEFTDTSGDKSPLVLSHFGVGMWIRNNWIRGNRAPDLVAEFHRKGLYDPDAISSTILSMVYKRLNNIHYNTDSIVLASKESENAYLNKMRNWESETRKHEHENSESYKVGDSVRFYILVDSLRNQNRKEVHNQGTYYLAKSNFEDPQNLFIDGIITSRNPDTSFTILISKINHNDIFMEEGLEEGRLIEVGHFETFNCRSIKIKKY